MDEVLRVVKALQVSDKQGAVAAGWPNNELIGVYYRIILKSLLSTA